MCCLLTAADSEWTARDADIAALREEVAEVAEAAVSESGSQLCKPTAIGCGAYAPMLHQADE